MVTKENGNYIPVEHRMADMASCVRRGACKTSYTELYYCGGGESRGEVERIRMI